MNVDANQSRRSQTKPTTRFRAPIGILLLAIATLDLTGGCTVVRHHRARIHMHRGEALLAADDLDAALAEFQTVAQVRPEMAVAHSRMGLIYRKLGRLEHAVDALIEAIRFNPTSFDDTFSLAQVYHLLRRGKDAIQAYLHAVRLRPRNFDAQLNLGVCYKESGALDQAVERFERAIEIDPDRSHAYVNLGATLDAQEKHYAAIRAYKEALERDGSQPIVLVNLAQTYMRQGRLKMARAALIQSTRLDPELAAAHQALGYCLFRMKDFDSAEKSYRQALCYDGALPQAHVGLGSIGMLAYLNEPSRTDRRERALDHWHRALELDPDQPKIRDLIARYQPARQRPDAVLFGAP